MRLIQNMCTIAEYPTPGSAAAADCCLGAAGRRLVKIAVVGASGVGKTGESSRAGQKPLISGAGRGLPPLGVADKGAAGGRGEELQLDRSPSPVDPLPLGRDLSHHRFLPSPSSDEGNWDPERPGTLPAPLAQLGLEFGGSGASGSASHRKES